MELLTEGFKVGRGLDLRNILITLLLHGAGFRASEPFHLYVSDVIPDPSNERSALVQAMGIAHHFEALLGTDDFDFTYKPAEKAYLTVCRMLNVPPEQCIMIDDSAANLHAAKALGMRTVWYGQQTHDLPFVDFAAADMAALCAWAAASSRSIFPSKSASG